MNIYVFSAIFLLLIVLGYFRSKRAKNKIVHIIINNCTGCQRCLKKCRHNALDMVNNETGMYVALKYPEKCTACGDCVIVCKFNALEIENRKHS